MSQVENESYVGNIASITVQYFCDNIDEILCRVEKEGIKFLILDDNGEVCCVLCPMDNRNV